MLLLIWEKQALAMYKLYICTSAEVEYIRSAGCPPVCYSALHTSVLRKVALPHQIRWPGTKSRQKWQYVLESKQHCNMRSSAQSVWLL